MWTPGDQLKPAAETEEEQRTYGSAILDRDARSPFAGDMIAAYSLPKHPTAATQNHKDQGVLVTHLIYILADRWTTSPLSSPMDVLP